MATNADDTSKGIVSISSSGREFEMEHRRTRPGLLSAHHLPFFLRGFCRFQPGAKATVIFVDELNAVGF
jgi:hypothetical protein